jgi:hypothetical protein
MKQIFQAAKAVLVCVFLLAAVALSAQERRYVQAYELNVIGKALPTGGVYQRFDPKPYGIEGLRARQAEMSTGLAVCFKTDARSIGVTAPVRESGDIAGSGSCKLVGPAGEVEVSEGVIAAKRHIHMTPADAAEFGVKDKDVVSVKVDTNGRALVFGDVVVRVSEKFALAMHIDTDESNAACAVNGTMGEMIK